MKPGEEESKGKHQTPFLYRYIDKFRFLVQPLDIFGLSLRAASHEKAIPANCCSARVGNSLFITGGTDEGGEPVKTFMEISINFNQIVKKVESEYYCEILPLDDMPLPKMFHGSAVLKEKDVVAIGGIDDEKKETNVCFRWLANEKKWDEICLLPKELAFISVVAVSGEFLYTFGGSNPVDKISTAILKYFSDHNIWDPIFLAENQGWKGVMGGVTVNIEDDQIMIFGGEGKEGCIRMSYLFDINTNTLRKAATICEDMVAEVNFPIAKDYYEDKVYCVHQDKCHIYDMKTCQWSFFFYENN
jgi:hypothetical protein